MNVPISTGIVDKWSFWCDRMHSATVYPQTKLVKDASTPRTNVVVLSDMPKKKTEEEDGEGFLAKLKKLF